MKSTQVCPSLTTDLGVNANRRLQWRAGLIPSLRAIAARCRITDGLRRKDDGVVTRIEQPAGWTDSEIDCGGVRVFPAELEAGSRLGGETDRCWRDRRRRDRRRLDRRHDSITATRQHRESQQRANGDPTGATHIFHPHERPHAKQHPASNVRLVLPLLSNCPNSSPTAFVTPDIGRPTELYTNMGQFRMRSTVFALSSINTPKRSRMKGLSSTSGRFPYRSSAAATTSGIRSRSASPNSAVSQAAP